MFWEDRFPRRVCRRDIIQLRENLTLMALKRYAQPWLNPKAEQQALRTKRSASALCSVGMCFVIISGGIDR